MLMFFTNPASKYAYLRTLKGENSMIWPTPSGSELVEGIRMTKILKFVPSRLLISLNQDNHHGNHIIVTVNIQKWGSEICLKYA